MKTRLLLASKSAARRRMLTAARVPFRMVEADFDEEAAKAALAGAPAPRLAEALAEGKALGVSAGPADLVLGSDQVLEREDGEILSKASTREELAGQLRSLRGRPHRLHAAAAVARSGRIVWRHLETATLHMRELSEDYLAHYLDEEFAEVRWSVGGYHLEARGAQLFDRVEGSHFAVLGMPLLPLLAFLRQEKVLPA